MFDQLVDNPPLRRLAAGEALFRQGDPAVAVYVVKSGRIRLLRHLEDGSSVCLHVARSGQSFAEPSLWAAAYHCDAVADLDSVVAVLSKAALMPALEREPAAALALARGLAAEVRTLRGAIELRNIRSAPQRVLAWLRLQAKGAPPTVALDRPWTRVAEEIGLTREALYRTLASLQAEGVIERGRGRVTLRAGAGASGNTDEHE